MPGVTEQAQNDKDERRVERDGRDTSILVEHPPKFRLVGCASLYATIVHGGYLMQGTLSRYLFRVRPSGQWMRCTPPSPPSTYIDTPT
jgi:hypothetical protein